MSYSYKEFSFTEPWLSKSSLLTYKFCPYNFYLQQVEDLEFEPTEPIKRGNRFHEWVENLYEEIDKEGLINGEKDLVEEYKTTMDENFSVKSEEEIELYKNFIEMEKERWNELDNKEEFFPIKTEEFLYDEDLMYFGSYDRLDKFEEEDGEDKHIVIDYKTGEYKDYKMSDYRFQLYGYKHLIEKNYDKFNVTHLGVVFPKEKKSVIEEFKSITGTYFYKRVEETREKILDRKFPKNTGACEYCNFYEECMEEWEWFLILSWKIRTQ